MERNKLVINTLQNIFASSGEKLIKALGLSKFQFVYFQEIINISIPVYIITVDSRYSSIRLSYSKLKKIDSTFLKKIRVQPDIITPNNFKLTPPMELKYYKKKFKSNAIVYFRDIAGEYFNDVHLYEDITNKYKRFYLLKEGKMEKLKRYESIKSRLNETYFKVTVDAKNAPDISAETDTIELARKQAKEILGKLKKKKITKGKVCIKKDGQEVEAFDISTGKKTE